MRNSSVAKPGTEEKRMLSDSLRLFGRQVDVTSHIDAWLAIALFAISLSTYSVHWVARLSDIHIDASQLGLHAHDLLQKNILPFYAYHLFAPSPLIIYLQALAFAVFGYSISVLQGVTIVAGSLTAPAVYLTSRWLFADQGIVFARRAGLIAALGLALSTLFASRAHLGTTPALLPVMVMLAVALLWRGFRSGSRLDFVLAGFLVGVGQYAYLVARLIPLALAIACAGAVLANRQLLAHWRKVLWAAAASALVTLPQLSLFAAYPYTFFARFTEAQRTAGGSLVFELPDPAAVIAAKLMVLLATLCSPWYEGFPGGFRAILTPVLVVGLAVGIAVVIRQRRDGQLFAFVMMALMLLPDLLTYEWEDHAAIDFSRLLQGLPYIYILAGLGAATVWAWLESRTRFPPWTGYFVLPLVLVFGLFRQWDYATRVQSNILSTLGSGAVYRTVTEFIGNHLDTPVLLPTDHYADPRLAFALTEQFPQRQSGEEETLREGERVTVILPDPSWSIEKGLPERWVLLKEGTAHFFPPMPEIIDLLNGKETTILTKTGVPAAKALEARWQGGTPSYIPLQALSYVNHLELVGFRSNELERGSDLTVTLFLRPVKKIERDVELVLELYNRTRNETVISKRDWPLRGVYRIRAWQPEQIMPLSYSLAVRPNLPGGQYQLQVGLVDQLSRQRILLASGQPAAVVSTFEVPEDRRVPQIPADINYGNLISLEGYTLSPTGEGLELTFFWRAIESPDSDYTLFVHVVNSNDQIVAQQDGEPYFGRYPTSLWSSNDLFVVERFFPAVPAGEYRVFIGWYTHREGGWERLSTVAREGMPATDHLMLDTITLP